MKNKFAKLLSFFLLFFFLIFSINTLQECKSLSTIQSSLTSDSNYSYNDLIDVSSDEETMYLGRVLKYFYANNVSINDGDINDLESYLKKDNSGSEVSRTKIELFIQNLISSTLNISIYGSSSDAEFFAEAFSKWLNTPDEIKNKSWEITNEFFIKVLPKILQNGEKFENEKKIIVDQVKITTSSEQRVTYNLDLDSKNTNNVVELKYSSFFNYTKYLENIIENIEKQSGFNISSSNLISIEEITKNWFNDSFTNASDSSKAAFSSFISDKWSSFDALDSHLLRSSLDKNGVSRISFKSILEDMKSSYLYSNASSVIGLDAIWNWAQDRTSDIEELILKLYNTLYSLVEDENWVDDIIIGFIVSPDYPLKKQARGVMGYTSTFETKDGSSNVYSYIVLTGNSLAYIDYNSQYKSGWWSTPSGFATIPHEMGHALDAFAGKINSYRDFSKYDGSSTTYDNLYSGEKYGYKGVTSNTSKKINKNVLTVVIIVLVVLIGSLLIFVFIIITKPKNKK